MITIYHNPRCRKSREAIKTLEERGLEPQVIRYLEHPLTQATLDGLLERLGMEPLDLVRKGETIWKTRYKGKNLLEKEVVAMMLEHPKLIERPIIVNGDKAVIGRSLEQIERVL